VPLTKADIDGLVEGLPDKLRHEVVYRDVGDDFWMSEQSIRTALYLAAGLTATGERKPERVRCWLHEWRDSSPTLSLRVPRPVPEGIRRTIPGTFVPDES